MISMPSMPGIFWSSTTASNREPSRTLEPFQSVWGVFYFVAVGFERHPHHAADIRFVVDDQHAPVHDFVSFAAATCAAGGRQREGERRAMARLGGRADVAAVRLHDLPGDGEPEAGAAGGAAGHLRELFKQARKILPGDAASGVAHRNFNARRPCDARPQRCARRVALR